MSSLGFQLVYNLLNSHESLVCERFFLPESGEKMLSIESGRGIDQFPLIFFSISFEHDYLNLINILRLASIPPLSQDRDEEISCEAPLIVCGGVATFINPEPLAPFIDLFFLGEAEAGLLSVVQRLIAEVGRKDRSALLHELAVSCEGVYVPSLYTPQYDEHGSLTGVEHGENSPFPVRRVSLHDSDMAGHSQLLTSETEFANLFLTELGRGCSRGCRFCTAGFIYRPPRLWDADAVLKGLREKFDGVTRVGLLGMEMMEEEVFEKVSEYLLESGCSLSFSSLRADRIDDDILGLLGKSNLKNVTIAPDGCSERLRRVINKGLDEKDILTAAERLVDAGIFKLKLYLMIGLPTETDEDLEEAVKLIEKIRERINPIGQERGRLCEISVSVNCFAPKPWTPFQYHPFGLSDPLESGEMIEASRAVYELKRKQKILQHGLAKQDNVSLSMDKLDNVLFQAVLSRADRRIAEVLLYMVQSGRPWNQAMKQCGLIPEQFAVRGYDEHDYFAWDIVDHGIKKSFLWEEYQKAFSEKLTSACDTKICRRCGVCHG